MKTFFQLREEKNQVTVGDYTTKHFDICPSAVKLYSKIKDMTPMVHLVVENMMLHDVFFRLEKQAIAQGSIDMDDLEKAEEYAELIMDNARQMGLEEEHSYIEDVHMAKFEQLAGVDDDEEEDDEDEEEMNEKTLTPAELKKREEIAKAIKRDNPNMPMAKKMAIATATAKKVAEATLRLDVNKASNDELKQYVKKSSITIARSPSVHPDVMHTHDAAQKELKKRQKMQKEEINLDEVSSSTLLRYSVKAAQQGGSDKGDKRIAGQKMADEKLRKKHGNPSTAKVAAGPARRESVELDEGITNLSHARLKFHATKGVPHGSYSNKEIKAEHDRRMRTEPDYVKAKASMNEETLDEAADQDMAKLRQLARMGLVDKGDVEKLMQAFKRMKEDKPLSPQQRSMLLSIVNDLTGIIVGDTTIFNKAKKAVSEEAQLDEISQATKDRYIQKAVGDHTHANAVRRDAESRGDTTLAKIMRQRMNKRNKGMTRAFGGERD